MEEKREDLGLRVVNEKLLPILESGSIPVGYENIDDWLCDFYPDISWNPVDFVKDCDSILNHPEFPRITKFFQEKYNFDFRRDLEEAKNRAECV